MQSGNWMWLSCSAFFSQYCECCDLILSAVFQGLLKLTTQDRVYGLVSWPVKTDKHGELVRKYCEYEDPRRRL